MRARIDDPNLEVTKASILVLAGCGAVGVPGMPEWGMIPIPKKLAADGVVDMVRVTDARMSGTSLELAFSMSHLKVPLVAYSVSYMMMM